MIKTAEGINVTWEWRRLEKNKDRKGKLTVKTFQKQMTSQS